MADGQVVFEIKGDPKDINQTVKQVTGNIQSESKKWDQAVGESTDKMGKSFSTLKTVAAGAMAAIGAALLKFGKEAIDAASDLAEVQNVVDTVFGDGAKQIETWSMAAGQQFGLTETQAKKFTSTLGAMMKSSGLAGGEIVKMSTDLAGLAADMASFYNLDFETAFEKIRSGISGETMPLKQLGINMSAANLEAFALAQGLEKTYQQMSQGEQTMLRYQYLMQATADAQGDFEKTSDGFANAQRRIESSLESIKTSVGTLLIEPFSNATSAVANFLANIAADMIPEKTILDEFNEIELDTESKMNDLQVTYDKAEAIIKLLDDISKQTVTLKDGSTQTFAELFKDLGNIEANGGDVRGYIESLGLNVDQIIQKYNVWKESTRQLTSLVPELSAQINSETGAIEGGTEALQANLDQWKANEEKKLAWAKYYAKARALEASKETLYQLEYEAGVAEKAVEKARAAMANVWKTEFDDQGKITNDPFWSMPAAQYDKWSKDAEHYNLLLDQSKEAREKLATATSNAATAEEYLADERQQTIEQYGEETDAVNGLTEAEKAAAKAVEEQKTAYQDALKALDDYYKGVHDATEQAVNSTVKGFEKITTAYDDLKAKQEKLAQENADTEMKYQTEVNKLRKTFGDDWMKKLQQLGEQSKEWKNLSDKEREAYNALVKLANEQKELNDQVAEYSPKALEDNLQSQIKFMQEYVNNLNQLKEWGVSEEMVSQLSDGSKESAAYLQGLVSGGKEEAQKVGQAYDQVAAKKKEFTDALTENKLAVDETFDAMVQKAKEAAEGLDQSEAASIAAGSTVAGIAEGISAHESDVSSAVDGILAQLNRLSGWGISFDFGKFGSLGISIGIPHYAGGTDWVPRDNFPAYLDYGEAVLTAEENRIWQMFKNGQQPSSMDYDALGGVMRDNVKPGGDVYLDGRVVGSVISKQQANSYRSLQRSGWQQ